MREEGKLREIPIHETFQIAAILAIVGGFLDAYTYILRGGVFANAQTGNMVLMGVRLADREFSKAFYYIIPIVAFSLGVFITELVKKHYTNRGFERFEHRIIAIEIILLLIVGVLPLSIPDSVINVTISFVCSLQVNSFRKVKNLPYATTMCTGNLRSGTEKLFCFLIDRKEKSGREAAHYFGIIILFITGAIVGTLLSKTVGVRSIWVCCILLSFVWIAMEGWKKEKV